MQTKHSWMHSPALKHGWLDQDNYLKENVSLSQQLTGVSSSTARDMVAPQLPILCWVWSDLGLHRSCACCWNLPELLCAVALLCPKTQFPLVLQNSFHPLFGNDPWGLGREGVVLIPSRTEHSVVSYSLYLASCWSVLNTICQKKPLRQGLRETLSFIIYSSQEGMRITPSYLCSLWNTICGCDFTGNEKTAHITEKTDALTHHYRISRWYNHRALRNYWKSDLCITSM